MPRTEPPVDLLLESSGGRLWLTPTHSNSQQDIICADIYVVDRMVYVGTVNNSNKPSCVYMLVYSNNK